MTQAREEPEADPDDDAGGAAEPTPTLSYATPAAPANFTTLRRLPAFEANLAAAKLEAAGINCFVADQNIATAHPLLFNQVRLQVAEADLDRAEEVLASRPGASASAGDEGEYVEEAYRCPKCHGKAVDLMPLSKPMRNTRLGCLGVLLLPVIITLATSLVSGGTSDRASGRFPPAAILAWLAVAGVLSYIVLSAKRSKRCRDCGHEWGTETGGAK